MCISRLPAARCDYAISGGPGGLKSCASFAVLPRWRIGARECVLLHIYWEDRGLRPRCNSAGAAGTARAGDISNSVAVAPLSVTEVQCRQYTLSVQAFVHRPSCRRIQHAVGAAVVV